MKKKAKTITALMAADLARVAAEINAAHARVERAMRNAAEDARAAGKMLIGVKAKLPHGAWLPWLRANLTLSERTAQVYMKLARNWDSKVLTKGAGSADLPSSIEGALALIDDRSVLQGAEHGAVVCVVDRQLPLFHGRSVRVLRDPDDPTRWAVLIEPEAVNERLEDAKERLRERLAALRKEAPWQERQAEVDALRQRAAELERQADEMARLLDADLLAEVEAERERANDETDTRDGCRYFFTVHDEEVRRQLEAMASPAEVAAALFDLRDQTGTDLHDGVEEQGNDMIVHDAVVGWLRMLNAH